MVFEVSTWCTGMWQILSGERDGGVPVFGFQEENYLNVEETVQHGSRAVSGVA